MSQAIRIEEMTGRDFFDLPLTEKKRLLKKAVLHWRKKGFPYTTLTQQQIIKEYKKLENSDCSRLIHYRRIRHSNVGLRLANFFHPQMWHIKQYGHTQAPFDHFNNDNTLYKLLTRATNLYPNKNCWDGHALRAMLRIHCSGRVANFMPSASKAIIQRFTKDHSSILDFCSGFGGRLLGSLSLRRHYVGIDASSKQVSGLRRLYKAVSISARGTAEILHGTAEDVLNSLKSDSFDLILSSPPYFNQEKYSQQPNQSFIRYPSYLSWKEKFLLPVVEQSCRILKPGGYFIINIADTKRQTLASDFELVSSAYFSLKAKFYLNLSSRPVHKKNGDRYKIEPIFIYQKVK